MDRHHQRFPRFLGSHLVVARKWCAFRSDYLEFQILVLFQVTVSGDAVQDCTAVSRCLAVTVGLHSLCVRTLTCLQSVHLWWGCTCTQTLRCVLLLILRLWVCVCHSECVALRRSRSHFCPSIMGVPGIDLRSPILHNSAFAS